MKTFQEFRKDTSVNEGWGAVPGIARDMIGGTIGNKVYDNEIKRRQEKNPDGYTTKDGKYKVDSAKKTWQGELASYAGGSAVTNLGWKAAKWGVTKGIPGAIDVTGKIISAVGAMNKMR